MQKCSITMEVKAKYPKALGLRYKVMVLLVLLAEKVGKTKIDLEITEV